MEREFLQNIKVGDQPLTKEVIDAIMAENGRDIESAKAPFADYETIKTQLSDAQTTIKGLQDQDIEGVRKSARDWETKYNEAVLKHQQEMADMAFQRSLDSAISALKGKSAKAISALLDIDTLKKSKNQEADIRSALDDLKKNSGYLFEEDKTPPPYAVGTGTQSTPGSGAPGTLKEALRERYNMK